MGKFYAVVSGLVPGIYTDWSTTERMVKGYPGAIYKSFSNRLDAEEFIKRSSATNLPNKNQAHILPLIDKTIIYTDGSYSSAPNDPGCGFGVVIIPSTGEKLTAHGKVPDMVSNTSSTNNIAELYAIYVALSLVKGDVILYSYSEYAVSGLTIYIHEWIKNNWKGTANRSLFEGIFCLMQGRKVSFQHIRANRGHPLNEEADRLALEGRLSNEDLIVLRNGERLKL